MRHTQIPLLLMHDLVRWDPQFDWTHKLFHTNNWVAIAARHLCDELLLASDAIEFAIATNFVFVTGFSMDYLTPLEHRTNSFKEFMHEWVVDQFLRSLDEFGLERPWYWDTFLEGLDNYHHMVYASAYSYRASVWFNFVVPGPKERAWLGEKYPT